MSLPSERQNMLANQILSTYLNSWLRCNYFQFGKANVRYIRSQRRNRRMLHQAANVVKIGPPIAEIEGHIAR